MKNGIKILIILILAAVIVYLSYYKKQIDDNTIIVETPVEKKSIKIEEDKDYIYDISTDEDYIMDVKIPYINIYSKDAKKAREQINKKLEDKDLLYSKYTYYSSSKVISLKIDYATDDEVKCLTYVFNDDGNLLSIKETANVLGIKDYKSKINSKIYSLLNKDETMDYIDNNDLDYDTIYNNNISKEYVGYFVNEKGLSVIIDLYIDDTNNERVILNIS